MSTIYLETLINAPIEKVFNLSRDIDFHQTTTGKTNEKAIAGKTTGLIELGESVTWRAKHLGIYQNLTTKITQMDFPNSFADEMQKGAFKSMKHQHIFKTQDNQTVMIDRFEFQSPLGIIGKIFDALFLKNYMKKFLLERNSLLKINAEK